MKRFGKHKAETNNKYLAAIFSSYLPQSNYLDQLFQNAVYLSMYQNKDIKFI